MRVLVVEDDESLARFLKWGLEREGHMVKVASDGVQGLTLAQNETPDLVLLDLGLPRKDGVEVLAELVASCPELSVLVLTGRTGVDDRVGCLDAGADDFLLKPFSLSELMARVRALGRRRGQFADTTLRFGEVELNRLDRRVRRNGQSVELTGKEFALLEYLMQARGRTCTRSELLEEVWQMSPDAGTNVVDVYVNYLRKKLGAAAAPGGDRASDAVIETVRGEGYAMAGAEKKPAQRAGIADGSLAGSVGVIGTGIGAGIGAGVPVAVPVELLSTRRFAPIALRLEPLAGGLRA